MSLPGPRFTYQDYCLMPEDKRCEVLEGELLMTPTPNVRHQTISMRLAFLIMSFVEPGGHGRVLAAPTDVILSENNVVQPDVLFVAKERLALLGSEADGVHGAPDLVIEILSPSTASRDRIVKRKLYGKYGVREYWVVDPAAQSIEVLTESPAGLDTWRVFSVGALLVSPLLPGLALPVAEIFRD